MAKEETLDQKEKTYTLTKQEMDKIDLFISRYQKLDKENKKLQEKNNTLQKNSKDYVKITSVVLNFILIILIIAILLDIILT